MSSETRFETAQTTKAYRDHCEDRVAAINDDNRTIIVVADGAGGIGNGGIAAETVIREIKTDYLSIETAEQWCARLEQIDFRINTGQATAVVIDLRTDGIRGASVGDSQAWIVDGGSLAVLTIHQQRKPLLGSQRARPISFSGPPLNGTLIVATDGFCDYVKREDLTPMVAQLDFYSIPRRCVEMVRLPSGELWDDVGIVACRVRPPHRTRKRYAL